MQAAVSRSNLALPYICFFKSLSLLTCPSTWPLDHGMQIAALTAASSWRTPLTKVRISGSSLLAASYNHSPICSSSSSHTILANLPARSCAAANSGLWERSSSR